MGTLDRGPADPLHGHVRRPDDHSLTSIRSAPASPSRSTAPSSAGSPSGATTCRHSPPRPCWRSRSRNFARSFCNGYGFDAIFRASLYLGLLPFVSTAALPLLLILPPAVLLFRRTLREAVVAIAGVLLPAFYDLLHQLGRRRNFIAGLLALGDRFITGKPFRASSAVPLREPLVLLGGIFVLDLLALLFFLSDILRRGNQITRPSSYSITCLLLLKYSVQPVTRGNPGSLDLTAIRQPLPFMFVRIHRGIAPVLTFYILLLYRYGRSRLVIFYLV